MRRTQVLTKKDVPYGQTVRITVRKNKVGRPFGVVETDLIFWKGFDYILEAVTVAIQKGIIPKAGAWLTLEHGGESLRIQGKEAAAEYYRDREEHFKELVTRINNFKEDSAEEALSQASSIIDTSGQDEDSY